MTKEKIDTIGRDEFIDKVLTILESLSENKHNTTFAIDGKWGVGKTFVLEQLEKRLLEIINEKTADNRYFVVHYNAWKYDYYNEPLIAIISAIVNALDEDKIIKKDTRIKIFEAFKGILSILCNFMSGTIKKVIGFDIKETVSEVSKIKEKSKKKIKEKNKYDEYFDLKKILKEIRDNLNKLSSQYTIVLVVDELDRCLPEYAIKVLERLHHLNEDVENMATIIAVDKSKLTATINKAFGYEDKDESEQVSEQYLKKFIKFTLSLKNGEEKDVVEQKFEKYLSLFKNKLFEEDNIGFKQFYNALFCDFEIRERETLMEKAQLVHQLVTKEECDKATMYLELIFVVFEHKLQRKFSEFFNGSEFLCKSSNPFDELYIVKTNKIFDMGLQPLFDGYDRKYFCVDRRHGLKGFVLCVLSYLLSEENVKDFYVIRYQTIIDDKQKDAIIEDVAKFRKILSSIN